MLLVFDLYDCIPSLCLNDSECDWPPIQDALRCKLELPYIGAEIAVGVFVVVAVKKKNKQLKTSTTQAVLVGSTMESMIGEGENGQVCGERETAPRGGLASRRYAKLNLYATNEAATELNLAEQPLN